MIFHSYKVLESGNNYVCDMHSTCCLDEVAWLYHVLYRLKTKICTPMLRYSITFFCNHAVNKESVQEHTFNHHFAYCNLMMSLYIVCNMHAMQLYTTGTMQLPFWKLWETSFKARRNLLRVPYYVWIFSYRRTWHIFGAFMRGHQNIWLMREYFAKYEITMGWSFIMKSFRKKRCRAE